MGPFFGSKFPRFSPISTYFVSLAQFMQLTVWRMDVFSSQGFVEISGRFQGRPRSMRAPSCELWRSLAKFGEPTMPYSREYF